MKHGACSGGIISKTYTAWRYIRVSYPNEICKEWSEFAIFYKDMGDKPDGHSLVRVDCNKKYSKINCVWENKRPINGKKKCAKCKKEKRLSEFIKDTKMHFSAGSYCLKCSLEINKVAKTKIKQLKKKPPSKKKCSVCCEKKPKAKFSKNESSRDGLTPDCKKCRNIKKKKYRAEQKKRFKKNGITTKLKVCCVCGEKKNSNDFYVKKTEADHLRPECKSCSTKLFAKNRGRINFRLACALRSRLYEALKNNSKGKKTLEYLGCSIEKLKQYLEKQFAEGMTWDNYGRDGWHIDHIKPISLFDLTNEEEIKKACHYTNLQPLWAEDNMKKGAKYGGK